MKHKCIISTIALLMVMLCACSSNTPLSLAAYVYDSFTDEYYYLGDSKEKFDSAFSLPAPKEVEQGIEYLGGDITVTFDHNRAVKITCNMPTDRFSFYGFNDDMGLNDISQHYKKSSAQGFDVYIRFMDVNGDDVAASDDFEENLLFSAALTVCNKDNEFMGWKKGQYIWYMITNETR